MIDASTPPHIITALAGLVGVFIGSIISGATQSIVLWRRIKADERLAAKRVEAEIDLSRRKFEYDKDLSERKFKSEQIHRDWERREKTYQAIIARIASLRASGSADERNELLNEARRLWLVVSPEIISKIDGFFRAVETGKSSYGSLEKHMGSVILDLRQDIDLDNGQLQPGDFRIQVAS